MTFTEWASQQMSDLTRVLALVIGFAITIFVLYRAIRSGMGLAAIAMALVAAALLWWALLGGGIEFVGQLFSQQAGD